VEKRKHAWQGLKITQFVTRDQLCSSAKRAIGEIAVMICLTAREANQSDRVQKKGGQERKKVIGIGTQFSGEVGGSEIGAGVVKRV
jgi:hypothetical protein